MSSSTALRGYGTGADAVDLDEPDSTPYVIELDGRGVGWIQWSAGEEPDYRYASPAGA